MALLREKVMIMKRCIESKLIRKIWETYWGRKTEKRICSENIRKFVNQKPLLKNQMIKITRVYGNGMKSIEIIKGQIIC